MTDQKKKIIIQEGNIPLLCAIEIGNVPVSRELLLSSTQVGLPEM